MSCTPSTTVSCGIAQHASGSSIPAVVFLPALIFGVALVVFMVLSLRGRETDVLRLVAGVALPIALVLQVVALVTFYIGTSAVADLEALKHLE